MLSRSRPSVDLKPLVTTAAQDLVRGAGKWELWGRLGWLDVKRRYRRTVIGPFWSSVSLAIYVGALGAVGAGLWHQRLGDYLPFLVTSLIVWMLVSSLITEGCQMLISGASLFRHTAFDYSILAYALVWRNLIVFLHHLVVYAAVAVLLAPHLLGPMVLLAVPGLLAVLVNGVWAVLLFGMLCLRFRDVQPLVGNVVQVAMFVTPIFWPPDSLEGTNRLIFVDLNPFHHVIDIVRAPLLGKIPSVESYAAVALITLAGWSLTYLFFHRFRRRIAYWS
jgi:ABC-type polysaccharide/polyol phosphate export permease